ncbi:MAG: hypothetical protein RIC55_36195 [Pirellulaceae bacterium]
MAYAIRFFRRAREELDDCCGVYGDGLRQKVHEWLQELAEDCSNGNHSGSIDVLKVLEEGLGESAPNDWKFSWKQWWELAGTQRAKALYIALKKRCPPWQPRMSVRWFSVLQRFPAEIHVFFLIDHVENRIIFQKFDGLPGQ